MPDLAHCRPIITRHESGMTKRSAVKNTRFASMPLRITKTAKCLALGHKLHEISLNISFMIKDVANEYESQ